MKQFVFGETYSHKDVWNVFQPGEAYPVGGPWSTGYLTDHGYLLAFLNVGVPGRTGHDFPNRYDEDNETIEWYGKPNAHSQQPTFRKLFDGELKLLIFLRWNNANTLFTYMGSPRISKVKDNVAIGDGLFTIQLVLQVTDEAQEQVQQNGLNQAHFFEGAKVQATVTRFERNPRLRAECVEHHGCVCKICDFDFEKTYGVLGRNFCHVHHISPLSEVGERRAVDPITDLIPVCPNCHAMIHRERPALTPDQVRAILKRDSDQI